jgi:hypothetical protein
MSAYLLTPLAKADIFDIWSYIAEENENAADQVEQAIFDACDFVAESPMQGHYRPDLTALPLPGAPGLAFETWETANSNRARMGRQDPVGRGFNSGITHHRNRRSVSGCSLFTRANHAHGK